MAAHEDIVDIARLGRFLAKVKEWTVGKLSGKSDVGHTHAASEISSGTLSTDRLPTVPVAKGGTGSTSAADARAALGITPGNIGAAAADHMHSQYLTEHQSLSAYALKKDLDSYVLKADMGGGGGFVAQSTQPDDTGLLWVDTANGNVMKFHDGTSWTPVGSTWG